MVDHRHLGERERKRSKVMDRFLAETKKMNWETQKEEQVLGEGEETTYSVSEVLSLRFLQETFRRQLHVKVGNC